MRALFKTGLSLLLLLSCFAGLHEPVARSAFGAPLSPYETSSLDRQRNAPDAHLTAEKPVPVNSTLRPHNLFGAVEPAGRPRYLPANCPFVIPAVSCRCSPDHYPPLFPLPPPRA